MAAKVSIVFGCLFTFACSGVRSVQLQPPIPAPPGLIWGYGAEKLKSDPDASRQSAYLKAMDDLMTRGPLLVSKTVQDNTTVTDARTSDRTMESKLRLRAARMLQPSFVDSGLEDGFIWVLIGTTAEDIERGWHQFQTWRGEKIEQARTLFQTSVNAPDRLPVLQASLAMLEEAGAAEDPVPLYYEVKTAFEAERARIAELHSLQSRVRGMIDNGDLAGADAALDQGLRIGLDPGAYNLGKLEVADRRKRAMDLMFAGDAHLRDEQYQEALERYHASERLDRTNPQLPAKIALADRYHRNSRSQRVRSTIGSVGWGAARVLGEYFEYKREQEERKRAEAERQAEEERNRSREEDRRRRPRSSNPSNRLEAPPADEPAAPPADPAPEPAAEGEPAPPKTEEPAAPPSKPEGAQPPETVDPAAPPAPARKPAPGELDRDLPLEQIRPKKKIG